MALSFSLSLCTFFVITYASLRVHLFFARFVPEICPQILEHKGCAHEVMDCFFPEFHVVKRTLMCTLRFGPKDFVLFRQNELDSGGSTF